MKPFNQCDETELKRVFIAAMMPDFNIASEVWGEHIIEKKRIRADYILRPKPHLVTRGFDDVYFAVEVKAPDDRSLFKCSSTMWQAASYVQSLYWGKVRPAFGIVFPDVRIFGDLPRSTITFTHEDNKTQFGGRILEHIGQFMNVGFLELKPDNLRDWSIRIGGVSYFSQRYGKSKMNLIKRYVGNKAA